MRNRPSIRTLVGVVVLAPILAVSLALVVLSSATSRKIAEQLGVTIVDTAAARIDADVRAYLSEAVRVSDLYTRRIHDRVLPGADMAGTGASTSAWERAMLDDLIANANVASICFGNTQGQTTWLLRAPDGLQVGRVSGPGADQAAELHIDPDGVVARTPTRIYTYDGRTRPWFIAAMAAKDGAAAWTPIYFWYGNQGADSATGTGFTRSVTIVNTPGGEPVGALVIDVTLGALSDYLRSLPLSRTGAVFIVDRENMLVAASKGPVNTEKGERMRIELSPDPIAQAAGEALRESFSNGRVMESDSPVRIRLPDGDARLKISRMTPYPGIDWRCLAIVPESDFLADARTVQRNAVLLALAAAAGALVVGAALSRRISTPLLKIAEHVKRVGAGDFTSRLDLDAARELTLVSDELNRAASGLKHRMELEQSLEVAMQVQQSLLPIKDPIHDRLDIVGRTKYCDATGGDYFDFLDVSAITPSTTLIALGDVMGHGVAAALLMATARAALRAHSDEQGSLASLMSKVNNVLARDARHQRFMTMALVAIDPDQGTVRWASAGHDPTIVYFPGEDRFQELDGGDVPLGMIEGVEYAEYRFDGLRPGCILLIGTDGIWEMHAPDGSLYGKQRMLDLVKAHAGHTAAEIADALEISLSSWRAERAALDDVTFVVVKFKQS